MGENNNSSGQTLSTKILCLCERCSASSQTRFHALFLASNYLGPVANSMITPDSKKRIQEPENLIAAASVLASLTPSAKNQVFAAALVLFGASFAEKVTLEHLVKSAEKILASSKKDTSKTTAQCIEELHAALPAEISSCISIDTAFLLLGVFCLGRGVAVLAKGGALAAGACLAATYCITSSLTAKVSGSQVVSAIATVTGFPEEVIMIQARILVFYI